MLLTAELNHAIVHAEIQGIRNAVETTQRLAPQIGAQALELGGGMLAFTGADSPLSQGYGVGSAGPVSADEVERITAFFFERGATPRLFVTPLADEKLAPLLAAGGYAPAEYENVLASDDLEAYARRDERVTASQNLDAWARASLAGFADFGAMTPGEELVAAIIAKSGGVTTVEVRIDGAIAATGAMDRTGEWSGLFAASTLPAFRKRGLHLAMIRDRIARARDAGARYLRATARPGGISERNFRRCGFTPLYTRTLWEKAITT